MPSTTAGQSRLSTFMRSRELASSIGSTVPAPPGAYVVDAERQLFAGDVSNSTVLGGVVAAALTASIGVWVGSRAMRRAS